MIRKINDLDREYLYSIIEKEFNTSYKDNIYTNWLIYELDNNIVGFINYDVIYDKTEIEYIYVDKKYRNKGIATKLLNEMINNLTKVDISLEVRSNNIEAINFYKKNKFKEITIRKNYYGSVDAILMIRSGD